MLVHRLAIATLLVTGIAWSQGGLSQGGLSQGGLSQGGLSTMPSIMPKKITKVEAKVVAVDIEKREMTFYDPERDLKDTYVVRKKTRLRADKKVFKGKPALEDFLEEDTVKITIIAEEGQLIEVRLMTRAAGG